MGILGAWDLGLGGGQGRMDGCNGCNGCNGAGLLPGVFIFYFEEVDV